MFSTRAATFLDLDKESTVGPLPKRKLSKTRKRTRRNHDKLTLPHLVACSNCGEPKLAHRVCPSCGYYDGEQVLILDKKDKKDS
jgi:large subunit ribosomal protein L32